MGTKVDCKVCGGTGVSPSNDRAACAACAGTGSERPTRVDEGVKALRKNIKRNTSADPFRDGTVIRWLFNAGHGRHYCFAALRAGGRWYLTGTGVTYGDHRWYVSYEELAKILARGDTEDVVVASAWTTV